MKNNNKILRTEEEMPSLDKEKQIKEVKFERNYGIDLSRIISIIFIINHHILFKGGILFKSPNSSFEQKIHLFLNIIYCSGVNIFGMISGFVGFHSHKYNIYNISIPLIFKFFKLIKKINYFLYPIIFTDYWYFNHYSIMNLYLPIINKGIISMSFKSMKNCIIILFLFFSCIGEAKNYTRRFIRNDIFLLNNGFSHFWLLILYFYGSYLGRFKTNKKNKNYFFYFKFIFLIFFSSYLRNQLIYYKMKKFKNNNIYKNIDFTIPSEVLISISVIILFSNIQFKNKFIIKSISFFSPLTFGVYLIHNHVLIREIIFTKYFFWILKYQKSFKLFLVEILSSLVVFLICSLIDYIRYKLFNIFKIRELCKLIEKIIIKISEKICFIEII